MATDLQTNLSGILGSGYLVLLSFTAATKAIVTGDVNTSSDRINLSGMSPTPVAGMPVYWTSLSATTDFSNSVRYYLVDGSSTNWGLATEPEGTKINITTAVSGTLTEAPPAGTVGSVYAKQPYFTSLVRHEVASYGSMAGRPAYTAPTTYTWVGAAKANQSALKEEDNTAPAATLEGFGYTGSDSKVSFTSSSDITWNYAVLIKGGSATRGNTTGTIQAFSNGGAVFGDGTSQTIANGDFQLPNFWLPFAPTA